MQFLVPYLTDATLYRIHHENATLSTATRQKSLGQIYSPPEATSLSQYDYFSTDRTRNEETQTESVVSMRGRDRQSV